MAELKLGNIVQPKNALFNVLNPQSAILSDEDIATVQRKRDQNIVENVIEGSGYTMDRFVSTVDDAFVGTVNPLAKMINPNALQLGDAKPGTIAYRAKADRDKYLAERDLEQQAIVGGRSNFGGGLAELATYALPAARLGIVGKGAMAVPKTAGAWAAADGAVSASLGNDLNQVIEDAALGGVTGGAFSGARSAYRARKASQLIRERANRPQLAPDGQQPMTVMMDGKPVQFPDANVQKIADDVGDQQNVGAKNAGQVRQEAFAGKQARDMESLTTKSDDTLLKRRMIQEQMEEAGLDFEDNFATIEKGEAGSGSSALRDKSNIEIQEGKVPAEFIQNAERILDDPKLKSDAYDYYTTKQREKLGLNDEARGVREAELTGDGATVRDGDTASLPTSTKANIDSSRKPIDTGIGSKLDTPLDAKKRKARDDKQKVDTQRIAKAQKPASATDELKISTPDTKSTLNLVDDIPTKQSKETVAPEKIDPKIAENKAKIDKFEASQKKIMSMAKEDASSKTRLEALEVRDKIRKTDGTRAAKDYIDSYDLARRNAKKTKDRPVGAKTTPQKIEQMKSQPQGRMPKGKNELNTPEGRKTAEDKKLDTENEVGRKASEEVEAPEPEAPKLKGEAKPSAEAKKKMDAINKERDDSINKNLDDAVKSYDGAVESLGKKIEDSAKVFMDEALKIQKQADDLFNEIGKTKDLKVSELENYGIVSKETKPLFDKIKGLVGDVEIRVRPAKDKIFKAEDGSQTSGHFDPDSGVIHIADDVFNSGKSAGGTNVVMHEVMHAVTFEIIRKHPSLANDFQELFTQAKKMDTGDNNYWRTNLDEFISEAFSNVEINTALRNTPYKSTTMWESFKNYIKDGLGINRDYVLSAKMDKMLDQLIDVSNDATINTKISKADKYMNDLADVYLPKLAEKMGLKFDGQGMKSTITNWRSSFETKGAYKTYQEIHLLTRKSLNDSALAGSNMKKAMQSAVSKLGKRADENINKHILETDFASIREIRTPSLARKFMSDNKALYAQVKRFVDQTAKGMRDKGGMNHPDYTNNGYQILQRAGLDVKDADLVDKMISVRSMSAGDWSFVKKMDGNPEFETILNMADRVNVQSKDIFSRQPHIRQKGYQSEIYDSIYKYDIDETGKATKEIDLEQGLVQGALPQVLDKAKTGRVIEFTKEMKKMSENDKLAHADMMNFGVVLDRFGKVKAMRKVATEAQRIAIGKSQKASDVISMTYENSVRKLAQRDTVIEAIQGGLGQGDLFVGIGEKVPKGFVELTSKELSSLPKEVQHAIKYVHPDFKQMLIGNKGIQVFKSGVLGVTEQLIKDSLSHFKENVILKNPASWANNMLFGMFMNLQEGISPAANVRYMKQGLKEKRAAEGLLKKKFDLEIAGKTDSDNYRKINDTLEKNLYYTLDQEGMAVTVMSNILQTPTTGRRMTDKLAVSAVNKMFGKEKGEKIMMVLSNMYISPNSAAGQWAMKGFGDIDAMSRYALSAHELKKSGTRTITGKGFRRQDVGRQAVLDAVKKSNGIYGDLDIISPMWSQAIQQYGAVPFSNWFFRVSGGMSVSTKENLTKALALYALLETVSYATDTRSDSFNPLKTLVATPVDMVQMSPILNPLNYASSVATPSIYKKAGKAIEEGDPTSMFLTDRF